MVGAGVLEEEKTVEGDASMKQTFVETDRDNTIALDAAKRNERRTESEGPRQGGSTF